MSNRVIICEASEIIAIGLAEIIDGMAQFDVVARLDSPEHLSEKITATDANLLILDPMLLGFHSGFLLSRPFHADAFRWGHRNQRHEVEGHQ